MTEKREIIETLSPSSPVPLPLMRVSIRMFVQQTMNL